MQAGEPLVTRLYEERVRISFPILAGMPDLLVSPNSASWMRFRPQWAGFTFLRLVKGGPYAAIEARVKGPLVKKDGSLSESREYARQFNLPGGSGHEDMSPEVAELFEQARKKLRELE